MALAAGRFAEVGWADRLEVTRILALAACAEVAARSLPLPRAARLFRLSYSTGGPDDRPEALAGTLPAWALRRLRLIEVAMWALPGDGLCLRQSLVTGRRLARLDPVLHIGVRRVEGRVAAHAWVVVAGVAVDAGDYAVLVDPRHSAASESKMSPAPSTRETPAG